MDAEKLDEADVWAWAHFYAPEPLKSKLTPILGELDRLRADNERLRAELEREVLFRQRTQVRLAEAEAELRAVRAVPEGATDGD